MSTIDTYLAELRAQLAGADPALVQDALYDAEEYLRSEAPDPADAAAVAAAIEAYGTPEEVASAYRETELTVARALGRPVPVAGSTTAAVAASAATGKRGFFGVLVDPSAYAALFYMFLSLMTGVVYFTLAVVGISVSLGTAILIVGIPLLLLFLAVVRAISLAEGRLVEGLLGVRMPRRPRVLPQSASGSMLDRIKSWITDARTWTTILYMVLMLPLGTLYFSLFVTLLATAAALVAAPFVQLIFHTPLFMTEDAAYRMAAWVMPLSILGGAMTFIVSMHLARVIGKAHAAFAKVMLVGRPADAAAVPTTTAATPAANGGEQ
jgi:uncharacterized membrane protein